MSVIFPNNYNSALLPMPLTPYERHMQKAAADFRKLQKVAEASDPTPKLRAETIGKVLQSGMLRGGANSDLQKRAESRRYDDPEKARLNKQVGLALARQPGHPFHPSMSGTLSKIASSGVGSGARALKAANDANLLPLNSRLPGTQGPDAIQVMNSLPDARVRQSLISALLSRPPASPNDQYKWAQSIVSIASQVRQMCTDMGLDGSALLDALSRRLDFFDPMVQSRPSRPSARADSISPNIDEPDAWLSDTVPPEEPMEVNSDFAGADRTDINPDFSNKSVLAKFYKVGRETGRDVCKTMSQRDQLEQYAKIVLSDFPPDLRKQIMSIHEGRNRAGSAEWARVQKTPIYKSIIHAITSMKGLSDQIRGACMALVTSRSEPPPFYLPG
jgi:hypothetical protein